MSECRKKKWAESNNISSKNNYQNNKDYNNGNNFKYNPNQNKGYSGNRDNLRCNFCNIKGHTIATCRHRQKQSYLNEGNFDASVSWCKYCKCTGHTISVCKKRIFKESQSVSNSNFGNNSNNSSNLNNASNSASSNNYNNYNNNPRRYYRCNDTKHIAKFCNNTEVRQNFQ